MGAMKRLGFFLFLLLLCLALIGESPASGAEPPEGTLMANACTEGWVMEGEPHRYKPDNLYTYINGEAELYMPYGFEILEAARYTQKTDPEAALTVDAYRMGSLLDAFGIYSYYRNPDARPARIGVEGFTEESQLMFYLDRYFIRLTTSGKKNPETRVFLKCGEALAKAVSGKISGKSSPPEELALLRIKSIVPFSERYVARSVLGYPFFGRGLTADITQAGSPAKVFIVFTGSRVAARDAWDRYVGYLKDRGADMWILEENEKDTLSAQDPLYKGTMVRLSGTLLFGVAKLTDQARGREILDKIQLNLLKR
jgi:hypothetical protein